MAELVRLPFDVRARFFFKATDESQIDLEANSVYKVDHVDITGLWYHSTLNEAIEGWFPKSFVELAIKRPPSFAPPLPPGGIQETKVAVKGIPENRNPPVEGTPPNKVNFTPAKPQLPPTKVTPTKVTPTKPSSPTTNPKPTPEPPVATPSNDVFSITIIPRPEKPAPVGPKTHKIGTFIDVTANILDVMKTVSSVDVTGTTAAVVGLTEKVFIFITTARENKKKLKELSSKIVAALNPAKQVFSTFDISPNKDNSPLFHHMLPQMLSLHEVIQEVNEFIGEHLGKKVSVLRASFIKDEIVKIEKRLDEAKFGWMLILNSANFMILKTTLGDQADEKLRAHGVVPIPAQLASAAPAPPTFPKVSAPGSSAARPLMSTQRGPAPPPMRSSAVSTQSSVKVEEVLSSGDEDLELLEEKETIKSSKSIEKKDKKSLGTFFSKSKAPAPAPAPAMSSASSRSSALSSVATNSSSLSSSAPAVPVLSRKIAGPISASSSSPSSSPRSSSVAAPPPMPSQSLSLSRSSASGPSPSPMAKPSQSASALPPPPRPGASSAASGPPPPRPGQSAAPTPPPPFNPNASSLSPAPPPTRPSAFSPPPPGPAGPSSGLLHRSSAGRASPILSAKSTSGASALPPPPTRPSANPNATFTYTMASVDERSRHPPPSGSWAGWYLNSGEGHQTRINFFVAFTKLGQILGSGIQEIARQNQKPLKAIFNINGSFDPSNPSQITFERSLMNSETNASMGVFDWIGTWNGRVLSGTISERSTGSDASFELHYAADSTNESAQARSDGAFKPVDIAHTKEVEKALGAVSDLVGSKRFDEALNALKTSFGPQIAKLETGKPTMAAAYFFVLSLALAGSKGVSATNEVLGHLRKALTLDERTMISEISDAIEARSFGPLTPTKPFADFGVEVKEKQKLRSKYKDSLSSTEIEYYTALFNEVDTNASGGLDDQEFAFFLSKHAQKTDRKAGIALLKQFGHRGELDIDGFLNCCADLKAKSLLDADTESMEDVMGKIMAQLEAEDSDNGGDSESDLSDSEETFPFMDAFPKSLCDSRHNHDLLLMKSTSQSLEYTCQLCREDGIGWCYSCATCKYEAHLTCVKLPMKEVYEVRPTQFAENAKCQQHDHPLVLANTAEGIGRYDGNSFICDICRQFGKGWRYFCPECQWDAHFTCAKAERNSDAKVFRSVHSCVKANKCTFMFTLDTNWHCITCGYLDTLGVCATCKDSCHRFHELEGPIDAEGFFCDCGADRDCPSIDMPMLIRHAVEKQTCTFEMTRHKPFLQQGFNCETCGIVGAEAFCESCALTCHAGHNVSDFNGGAPASLACCCHDKGTCKHEAPGAATF